MKILRLIKGYSNYFEWKRRNKEAIKKFESSKEGIEQFKFAKLVKELRLNGIAQIHMDDIEGGTTLLEDLKREYYEALKPYEDTITLNRNKLKNGKKDDSVKDFIIGFNTHEDRFELDSALMRFALHPEILSIANGYNGMMSKVTGLKFWYTVASENQLPTGSQLWHRDYDDIRYLKAFVYLEDVGESAGPFVYAKGSNRGLKRWLDPEYYREKSGGKRATDERMAAFVGKDNWKLAIGRAGSIIFADVAGLHKGGYALKEDRKLLYVGYLSAKPLKKHRANIYLGRTDDLCADAKYAIEP